DFARVEQIVINLVTNAAKYTDEGGRVSVTVQCHGPEIGIEVADTGIGMDEDTRANMFKPFFTTKGENGTGLGLAIVDQIIARVGGFIRVESQQARGTTVRLYIPRIATAVD
ncbi:MAG TPA: ATP-binding protein, partial [Povalibacter sp.]|nr:ATP-binding protein [Povalibacter sp.]